MYLTGGMRGLKNPKMLRTSYKYRPFLVHEFFELERFGSLDEVRVAVQRDGHFTNVDELQKEVDVLCGEKKAIREI